MSTHFLGSYFCSHSDRLEKRNTVVHCHTINHCYGTPLTFVGRSLHKSCFVLWPVSSPSTVSNSFVFQQNDSFVFQSDWSCPDSSLVSNSFVSPCDDSFVSQSDWWRPALRISPNSFATLCRQFIGLLRCFAQYRIRVGLKYHRFQTGPNICIFSWSCLAGWRDSIVS